MSIYAEIRIEGESGTIVEVRTHWRLWGFFVGALVAVLGGKMRTKMKVLKMLTHPCWVRITDDRGTTTWSRHGREWVRQ